MRWRKILLVGLMIVSANFLQAQSRLSAQKGKHTLSVFPLHSCVSTFEFINCISPLPAVAYNYNLTETWSLQAKLFYREQEGSLLIPGFGVFSSFTLEQNKSIKLGVQSLIYNKSFQVLIGLSTYLESRKKWNRNSIGFDLTNNFRFEKEGGLEFGLSIGIPFGKHARLILGSALRYGKTNVRRQPYFNLSYTEARVLPIETFGFAYTF